MYGVGDLLFSPTIIKWRKEPPGPLFELSVAVVNPNCDRPEGNTCQNEIDVMVLIDVCCNEVRWNVAVKVCLQENSAVSLGELNLDCER